MEPIELETKVMGLVEHAIDGLVDFDEMHAVGRNVIEGVDPIFGCDPRDVMSKVVRERLATAHYKDQGDRQLAGFVQEQDEVAFSSGYERGISGEQRHETRYGVMRGTAQGVWGEPIASVELIRADKTQNILLNWCDAGEVVKQLFEQKILDVKIRPYDQGLLYANIDRSLNLLVANRENGSVLQRHPKEAIAGLYLLGRLDGIETPELQQVIKQRPLLRLVFETELARLNTGDPEVYAR